MASDIMSRQTPKDMILRRSDPTRGERVLDGCSNVHQLGKFSTDRQTCYFSMSDLAKALYEKRVEELFPGGKQGFARVTGCHLDCKPYSQATVGSQDDVKVNDAWISTSDDGQFVKQLNIKAENVHHDEREKPLFSTTPASGCPFFHPSVEAVGEKMLFTASGRR